MSERSGARAGCPVCSHIERRLIDVGFALDRLPTGLARKIKNLSMRQIKAYRDRCLDGDTLVSVARERGWLEEAS